MAPTQSQVICAPSTAPAAHQKTLFLAGTTSPVEPTSWRTTLCASLADAPLTIYDPFRADWDGTWREDVAFAPFREQVEWELAKQQMADLVVFYFHPATQAPISLLELGLAAGVPGKAVVVCPEGYWKRGNVQVVCEKFGIKVVEGLEALKDVILERLCPDS